MQHTSPPTVRPSRKPSRGESAGSLISKQMELPPATQQLVKAAFEQLSADKAQQPRKKAHCEGRSHIQAAKSTRSKRTPSTKSRVPRAASTHRLRVPRSNSGAPEHVNDAAKERRGRVKVRPKSAPRSRPIASTEITRQECRAAGRQELQLTDR